MCKTEYDVKRQGSDTSQKNFENEKFIAHPTQCICVLYILFYILHTHNYDFILDMLCKNFSFTSLIKYNLS